MIVLGKYKIPRVNEIPGVSDKQYPIRVQWKKPIRIETCNPAISGDIGGLEFFGEVDKTQPPVSLEGSTVLSESQEVVKEILSLNFGRRRQVIEKLKKTVADSVKSNRLDTDSLEVKIALLTVKIRSYQQTLTDLYPYKNQPLKHDLTYKIALRRKLLEILREKDYKKYEWILEKLNLFYKPVPQYDVHAIGRKTSIEKLTDLWCNELREHRLESYKRELQHQQPKFLRDKAEKLKFIMEEEKQLGLEKTVFQKDIDDCVERAQRIEEMINSADNQSTEYLIYKEEKAPEQNFIN